MDFNMKNPNRGAKFAVFGKNSYLCMIIMHLFRQVL